jgi:transcriptional regulator with XRE-family HTH domain
MDDSARPGARIAEARKALGLTQLELAARAGVGYGTLAKVETGHQAASSTWLGAVARALGVDVAYILGSPYLDTAEGKAALHQYIPPIRRALAAYNLLDAEDEVAPRSLAALTADVDQLGRWRRDTAYDKVGAALPGLIAELQRAAAELPAEDSHKAAALLANSYRAANTLAHKLGYVDLSLTAMERMERAAEKSNGPAAGRDGRLPAGRRVGPDRRRQGGAAAAAPADQQPRSLGHPRGRGEPRVGGGTRRPAHARRRDLRGHGRRRPVGGASRRGRAAGRMERPGPGLLRDHLRPGQRRAAPPGRRGRPRPPRPRRRRSPRVSTCRPGMARERQTYYWIDRARAHLLAGDLDAAEEDLYQARTSQPTALPGQPSGPPGDLRGRRRNGGTPRPACGRWPARRESRTDRPGPPRAHGDTRGGSLRG